MSEEEQGVTEFIEIHTMDDEALGNEEEEEMLFNNDRTLQLIHLYKKYKPMVEGGTIKTVKQMWEIISKEISKICNKNITAAKCDNRFKVLERSYKKVRETLDRGETPRKMFPFYEEFKTLPLGKKYTLVPGLTAANYSSFTTVKFNNPTQTKPLTFLNLTNIKKEGSSTPITKVIPLRYVQLSNLKIDNKIKPNTINTNNNTSNNDLTNCNNDNTACNDNDTISANENTDNFTITSNDESNNVTVQTDADNSAEIEKINEILNAQQNALTESSYFNHQRTAGLISLYKKYEQKYVERKIKTKHKMWNILAREMSFRYNVPISGSKCENRWRVLERNYKKSLITQRKCEFFDDLKEIIGDVIKSKKKAISNTNTPPATQQSDTPQQVTIRVMDPKQTISDKIEAALLGIRNDFQIYYRERLNLEREKLSLKRQKLYILRESAKSKRKN